MNKNTEQYLKIVSKVKYVAIDGLDGSGKTSVAKELARRLDWNYAGKPASDILGGLDAYGQVANRINNISDPLIRQWFYALGWLLVCRPGQQQKPGVVLDRFLGSSFGYNANPHFDMVADLVLLLIGRPLLVVLLDLPEELRRQRLIQRDGENKDSIHDRSAEQKRIIDYLERNGFDFLICNAAALSVEGVVDVTLNRLMMGQ